MVTDEILKAAGAHEVGCFYTFVKPNDDEDLGFVAHAIYVGVSGDIKSDFAFGIGIVLPTVAVGLTRIPALTKIYKTGTSASSIVALYREKPVE